MRSLLLFSILTLIQSFALADGRDVAVEVCRASADPRNCLAVVQYANYIDEGAARGCAYNRVYTVGCIQAIVNKVYNYNEVQYCASPALDEQRRIRCFTQYGQPFGSQPGQPAPYPMPPPRPRPYPEPYPMPPPRPIEPAPLVPTAQWINLGTKTAPKAITETDDFLINQTYATEILVSAKNADVNIQSAVATDQYGRQFVVNGLLGTVRENTSRSARLTMSGMMPIQSLRLEITSPSLFGSRGDLTVQVGVAR